MTRSVPGIERDELIAAARYSRPSRYFISELKDVFGECVEMLIAIHEPRKVLYDNFKKGSRA
jgi:hypothetical protein